tara:strand:- start:25741 stop:26658 length:918 start_codon:yes stop_codon:yes gene_type:complete
MKCRLCNGKSFLIRKKIRNNINRKVYKCSSCTVEFLEDIKEDLKKWYSSAYRNDHTSTIGDVSSNEPKAFYELNLPLQHRRFKHYIKYLKKTHHVLDIGCSTGHWLNTIKPYVKKVYGLELNKDHSAFVNKELKIDCFNDEIKNYNAENKFDIISFFQVFEHIPNPKDFLMHVKKRIKKNGKIIIELPNLDDPLIFYDNNEDYKNFYYRRPHEFYYNKKSLLRLLRSVGLKGKINGIHRYNYGNLIHWHLNKTTQSTSEVAMAKFPINVKNKKFMKVVNLIEEDYKSFLEKNLKSESMYFVGTFK